MTSEWVVTSGEQNTPLTLMALTYAWRQLVQKIDVTEFETTSNSFDIFDLTVFYGDHGWAETGNYSIVVIPCGDEAWQALLARGEYSLQQLPMKQLAPEGFHLPFSDPLPVLLWGAGYEDGSKPFAEVREDGTVIFYADILASTFFLLSRYEETISLVLDKHSRFSAGNSLAHNAGFLHRPLVDEYAEVIWTYLKRLWPNLERKQRKGRVFVTCDVDHPFDCAINSPTRLVRMLGNDLLKSQNPQMALNRVRNAIASRQGNYRFDPYDTFDWYMDTCEKHGRKAAFYCIAGHSAGTVDGCYTLEEPRIRQLLRRIGERGHEIGMHGSYDTFRNPAQLWRERQYLIAACERVGVDASVRGNRQHFLRWDILETPDHLDAAGFEYDTTGSFADAPGFRYGTAHPFAMWSWQKNAALKIQQRPLIIMECSVIAERYLGLGYTQAAIDLMLMLKQRALAYGGDFVMLWHNSHLTTPLDREFFEELIR